MCDKREAAFKFANVQNGKEDGEAVGHFPTSENGMLESEGIQKFKEEKIFEKASERCVTVETEALRTRKKKNSGRW